ARYRGRKPGDERRESENVESAVAQRVTGQSEGKTDPRETAPHEGRIRAALHPRHPFDREILALAVPAPGTLAADPLVSMVDTAFVGRLGVVPLAALGVNVSIFGLAFLVFNFLAYGTTPMVARAVGAGDRARAGRLAVEALTLAIVAGIVAVAIL